MDKKELLVKICEAYKNGFSWEYIFKKYGGSFIYVPKIDPKAKEKIKKEFKGDNHAILAHKYNVSENTIRAWLKEKK